MGKGTNKARWNDFILWAQNRFGLVSNSSPDPASHLQMLKEASARLSDDDNESIASVEEGDLRTLNDRIEFKDWVESSENSLLLIRAVNHHDSDHNSPVWLSQAVAEFAMHLRDGPGKVMYHVVSSAREHPSAAIGSAICQAMVWEQNFYEMHQQEVKNALDSYQQDEENLKQSLELLNNLLGAWSTSHDQNQAFLIIQRPDQWVQNRNKNIPAAFKLIMEGFLRMLENKSSKIKICLLIDDSYWYLEVRYSVDSYNWRGRLKDTGRWRQANANYYV